VVTSCVTILLGLHSRKACTEWQIWTELEYISSVYFITAALHRFY